MTRHFPAYARVSGIQIQSGVGPANVTSFVIVASTPPSNDDLNAGQGIGLKNNLPHALAHEVEKINPELLGISPSTRYGARRLLDAFGHGILYRRPCDATEPKNV